MHRLESWVHNHTFLKITPKSYPTKWCHCMAEEAVEARNEMVGLERGRGWKPGPWKKLLRSCDQRGHPDGPQQKERMSGDTESESRSSTLSLPQRATFRETSHQLQPYLQAFRLATLLFIVRKKALTLPHYHLYAAIWWKVHNKNEPNYYNLFLVRFCWFISSDTEKYILCTFVMPFDICFIQIFSWLLLARF